MWNNNSLYSLIVRTILLNFFFSATSGSVFWHIHAYSHLEYTHAHRTQQKMYIGHAFVVLLCVFVFVVLVLGEKVPF